MASSSSSPSVPAFSSQSWKHHVFLSFRGEDTRKTFVDHLYSALEQQGIHTYKDDETLPRGESIGPSLMKAIEESQIAIIIFSENYADSSWCLDELACIMKCKDMKGQIVMPIFYGVEPSEVRKQKRKYGEAFAKHELENKKKAKSWGQAVVEDLWGWLSAPREQNQKYQEAIAKHELDNKAKVESWRKALADASNISGWEPKHIANGHEARVIKEIVDTILERLQLVPSSTNENLIGMEARMQRLKSELEIGSGGVRMIGIWGVGGGGKTTLASSIYDEISGKFDGCCFVENIREESSKNGLVSLQKKILSGVLKQKNVHGIERVEEGRRMIIDRLCHRKVLIVLDDVNQLDQLEALAGSHDWFGKGSRIIITTRDEHVLIAHRVNVTHNIRLLNSDEAIKLFRKRACWDHTPMEDYEQLSKEVVSYAGGLPLALTVLGSFLCDKDINEWRSALARLKEIPDTDIVQKLKISFDGLKPLEKDLFLDIACFYRSKDKNDSMVKLDACGFHPVIGVKVLIQKALITISEDGKFDMHDLVQEMGHFIVRGEHPKNPEKQSRFWKKEDLLKICDIYATTKLDKIEAIEIWDATEEESQLLMHAVTNMKMLRLFTLNNKKRIDTTPLPGIIPPRELCSLRLSGIMQKQLWEGYRYLPYLKNLILVGLENLISTPDFDGLPNLERFEVSMCNCLEEVHPSVVRLERLVLLDIEDCESLKILPPITRLKKLETLSISFLPEPFKLSEIQEEQNMDSLPHLDLDNDGEEVASSIESSTNLFVNCWRCGCSNLSCVKCCLEEPCLPHNNMNHHKGLWFSYIGLRELRLVCCKLGDKEMGSAFWDLPNLQELDLEGNEFSRLNFSLLRVSRLKYLKLSDCGKLVELTELPSSIAIVVADWCRSLESFGDISNCKWLWKVTLDNISAADKLLDSMLQGNAVKDHFISVSLAGKWLPNNQNIPRGVVVRGKTFRLPLPNNWYKDFCGFLVSIVMDVRRPKITIMIKEEVDDENSEFEVWQEPASEGVEAEETSSDAVEAEETSSEASEADYEVQTSSVGYVSFNSLRHTALSNSSYNMISFSLEDMDNMIKNPHELESCVGFKLIPRSTGDQAQTRDCSEYWYNESGGGKTFSIQYDSQPSINILWRPTNWR